MQDNRRRIIILLFIITLIFSFFTVYVYSQPRPTTSARAAALYEPETKSFIYTKNENEQLAMASTTKILTALLALERLSPDEKISVPPEACGIEGSSIYLKPGEVMSAVDLVYSVLLQSANDAAAALAYKIAGSIDAFAQIMNETVRELGLTDTHFKNPHGLDDPEHYTTAHDLAIISAYALENEDFCKISSTYKKKVISSESERLLVNHNKLLRSYDGCIGVKTGFTHKSGRCLVSAAERNELRLISVTIDAPDDWNDHKKMLDLGYSLLEAKVLAEVGEFSYKIPVINGKSEYVFVSNQERLKLVFDKTNTDYDTHIKLARFLTAPINEGDILGRVIFTQNGKEIGAVDIVAEESIENNEKRGFFSFLKH